MNKVTLSAPWYTYFQKLNKLFGDDPEIKVVFDEDDMNIKLYVENNEKAEAISKILPVAQTFGNIEVKITIIPANELVDNKITVLEKAFDGNPAVQDICQFQTPFGIVSYVVFANKVVQFFNDDMGDINGNCSTLYQEIAKEILGNKEGIFYCTAAAE